MDRVEERQLAHNRWIMDCRLEHDLPGPITCLLATWRAYSGCQTMANDIQRRLHSRHSTRNYNNNKQKCPEYTDIERGKCHKECHKEGNSMNKYNNQPCS
ncbi:uncharacterized protein Dana_GF27858, isoform A [Drosophila ananassae]|uniref:Uncharacterized protein, isoform A n=1 Tax=Drosophila ananassae TaxID=7217 RepID=A0A0P8XRC5_DROAN|nr:uncharacterized protein Dana_GF27858, isoform A [Drosophila ananassae]